jgi:hypothetical protein
MTMAFLSGSYAAVIAAAPSWIVEPEKVYECRRHQSYVTGGLGYSHPYSCWTPLCNGCSIGEDEKPENRGRVLARNIVKMESKIKALREKIGVDESFVPNPEPIDIKKVPGAGYTKEQLDADPRYDEMKLAILITSLEESKKELSSL